MSETGQTKNCPWCAEPILVDAKKCKHCGEIVDPTLRAQTVVAVPQQRLWSPGVAAVLSLFFPGVGQMYKGQVLNGLAWMFFVALGYVCFILPGLVLHLFCIFGAASGNPNAPVKSVG